MDDQGFESQQGQEISLVSTTPSLALQITQPFFNGYWFFLGVKQSEHEVDHLHV
jgi:hypothetical protein